MKQKDVANPCRDSRFSPPFDMAPISDETSQGKCIIQNLDFRSIGSSVGAPLLLVVVLLLIMSTPFDDISHWVARQ